MPKFHGVRLGVYIDLCWQLYHYFVSTYIEVAFLVDGHSGKPVLCNKAVIIINARHALYSDF